ncbi:MAG: trypsin-like peptidase domain-containing protein [Candidatus Zixiibacteriota bacterium]|nr:MAG: trypsin-like peptidase domain-containing protein [candidate division Zixibacteria bacterium]
MTRIVCTLLLTAATVVGQSSADLPQQRIYRARDRVLPALVHIQPVIKDYRTGELKKQSVIGSGVIFSSEGYVVTNYHVAGKAERIICTLSDKEQVPAVFVGGDPSTDLAVLRLKLEDYHGSIHVAEFGTSEAIEVGQQVLAMGSPLSLSRSVSAGVISTKDRYFSADYRLPSGERTGKYNLWIQTDAAINPGNSGGPLVDLDGRVIGINSRATFMANNLGFAIPIDVAKTITDAVITDGKVVRSWIGVECQALQELESWFGTGRNEGVLIASVVPGSPANKNFLQAGDVILAIDGSPVSARFVEELPAFYGQIASYEPGTEITLQVLRADEEYEFTIRTEELGDLQGEDFECAEWGFTVKAITQQMQIDNLLDDTIGVFVTGVKRAMGASPSGLRPGDVISSVNRTRVAGLTEFVQQYNELVASETRTVVLRINRSGAMRFHAIKVDSREEGSYSED